MELIILQMDLGRQKENLPYMKSYVDFAKKSGYNAILFYMESAVRTEDTSFLNPDDTYSLEELDRPGEFNPEAARALNVPVGPLWSKLQAGQSVTASDGSIVTPEQVMGAKRSGRKFSYVTDTMYMPSIAPAMEIIIVLMPHTLVRVS